MVKRETLRELNATGQEFRSNEALKACGCTPVFTSGTITVQRVATPFVTDTSDKSADVGEGFDKMAAKENTGSTPKSTKPCTAFQVIKNCDVSSTCWLLTCQRQPAGDDLPNHCVSCVPVAGSPQVWSVVPETAGTLLQPHRNNVTFKSRPRCLQSNEIGGCVSAKAHRSKQVMQGTVPVVVVVGASVVVVEAVVVVAVVVVVVVAVVVVVGVVVEVTVVVLVTVVMLGHTVRHCTCAGTGSPGKLTHDPFPPNKPSN